jgi:hypothetical protein
MGIARAYARAPPILRLATERDLYSIAAARRMLEIIDEPSR